MDDCSKGRHVVARPDGRIQFEETNKHRGDNLTVSDRMGLHSRQICLWIEMLHDDGGASDALGCHGEAQGGCVVHGSGTQIDALIGEPEEHAEHRGNGWLSFVEDLFDEGLGDPLRLARGPR